jgi:hypothetical protein
VSLDNIRARAAAWSIVDPESPIDTPVHLFSDRDIEALGEKSAAALDRVFATIQEINKLSDRDVEELAKNSPTGQSDASSSD